MRSTLHFVAAADVRWMLKLLMPRFIANSQGRYRWLELDEPTFARSAKVLTRALRGSKQLTRQAVYKALEASGIVTAKQRGMNIVGRLAQEGLICFGVWQGKHPTFVLLDEWIPESTMLHGDEALAELAARYFTSHGPATLQDFIWWSGLTTANAKAGLEMVKSRLEPMRMGDQVYWTAAATSVAKEVYREAHLLPVYDEFTVGYKDRSAALNPLYMKQAGNGIFTPVIMVAGKLVGTWRRTHKSDTGKIALTPFTKFSRAEMKAIADAAQRYGDFVDSSVGLARACIG